MSREQPTAEAAQGGARKPPPDLAVLEARIGHGFADRALLETALTHMSAESGRGQSYQRLEFLGDRVLGLAVAELLFARFPGSAEGEMSRRLAELVRKDSCADVATAWHVGPHLRLGEGEVLSGARRNRAILADACEAIIGAVFVDGGYEPARSLVERAFADRLTKPARPLRDAKTLLQEWAQGAGYVTPSYAECARSGPDHAPLFRVVARVAGLGEAEAEGRSKRLAEQAAAELFLRRQGLWTVTEDAADG